jgi:hypothetical protein
MQQDIFSLTPERLVIYGFRNVMAAHDLNKAEYLERAWRDYIDALGTSPARRLLGELQYWTRTIRCHAAKSMHYFACRCPHICHDECMAVAMIAAAQCNDRRCTELAASHLLCCSDRDSLAEAWLASSHFGTALKLENLELFPVTAQIVTSIVAMEERNIARASGTQLH